MGTSEPAIEAIGIRHEVGGRLLFDALDLTVRAGDVHAVVAPSGAGKSTLLRMIGGLERPGAGTIRVLDHDVTALRGAELRRHLRDRVAFVFQDAGLVERWTVRQNITAAAAAAPHIPVGEPSSLDEAADLLHLPQALLGRRAAELSGGERQRVAIAGVLVRKPPVVLMDEPTAALDAELTDRVVHLVRDLSDQGATIVMATHDPVVIGAADSTSTLFQLPT